MVVIRRELLRTNGAGPVATGLSHRRIEDPPLPRATPAADRLCPYRAHEFLAGHASGGPPYLLVLCALEFHTDRPDEAEQLSAERGDHLLFGLAPRQQGPVTRMQAMLRVPSNGLDGFARAALTCRQRFADARTMAVAPSRLGHDAPQVCVARLTD